MWPIFVHTVARLRGHVLGWGLSMMGIGLLVVPLYEVVLKNQQQFEALLKNYPPEMSAFFGGLDSFATPEGFLSAEFFAMAPVILGIFAILAGSGLVASDEENGTLDLILAHPISRAGLFAGRVLGLVVATLGILTLSWAGLALPLNQSSLDVSLSELALPFGSLFAVLMVFAALALFFSQVLPSRRLAAMLGGVLVVVSYFVTSLARLDEGLEQMARLSPLNYYQSGRAIGGLNWEWMGGLMAVAAALILLAGWRFERRDVRVGGEGGWQVAIGGWRRRRAESA